MTVKGDDIAWKYIDYGWKVNNKEK